MMQVPESRWAHLLIAIRETFYMLLALGAPLGIIDFSPLVFEESLTALFIFFIALLFLSRTRSAAPACVANRDHPFGAWHKTISSLAQTVLDSPPWNSLVRSSARASVVWPVLRQAAPRCYRDCAEPKAKAIIDDVLGRILRVRHYFLIGGKRLRCTRSSSGDSPDLC